MKILTNIKYCVHMHKYTKTQATLNHWQYVVNVEMFNDMSQYQNKSLFLSIVLVINMNSNYNKTILQELNYLRIEM